MVMSSTPFSIFMGSLCFMVEGTILGSSVSFTCNIFLILIIFGGGLLLALLTLMSLDLVHVNFLTSSISMSVLLGSLKDKKEEDKMNLIMGESLTEVGQTLYFYIFILAFLLVILCSLVSKNSKPMRNS